MHLQDKDNKNKILRLFAYNQIVNKLVALCDNPPNLKSCTEELTDLLLQLDGLSIAYDTQQRKITDVSLWNYKQWIHIETEKNQAKHLQDTVIYCICIDYALLTSLLYKQRSHIETRKKRLLSCPLSLQCEGTKHDVFSIFLDWLIVQDEPPRTQAIGKTTLPSNVISDDKNLSRIELLRVQFLCKILKQKRTLMTDMNERTPESHECKRQLRLHKQREQRRARLASETKEQREQRLQLQRTAHKRHEQLFGWKNKWGSTEATESRMIARCQQTFFFST